MRRPVGVEHFTVLIDPHELQVSGCHSGLISVCLANAVVHHEQNAWFDTIIVRIHQYRTLQCFPIQK